MLTDDQLFAARDNCIRVREIKSERTEIKIGTISYLDAMMELGQLAEMMAPALEAALAENAALRKQLAGGNRP